MQENNKLINDFWNDYVTKKNDSELSEIVKGIPLIWHGNMDSYFTSKRRVVTVSLNPHFKAFDRKKEQFSEVGYNLIEHLETVDELNDSDINMLIRLYDEYFINNLEASKDKVFKGYNNLFFDILNASYFNETGKNQVLHIDAASAIATKPVWSKISVRQQRKIENYELTMKLLKFLNPNVVLYTGNKIILDVIIQNYYQKEEKELIHERVNSEGSSVKIYSNKSKDKIIVFTSNSNRGPLTSTDKEIGKELAEKLKIFLEV